MKKLFKIVGIIVGVVVLLVIIAVIGGPLIIDPNDHKEKIAQKVKEDTGRDLKIEGDIELTVFPWLGVDLGRVVLGNAAGFDGDHFASTERVQVRVKVWPLLQKQVEMGTINIEGLTLNLMRDAEGRTNLDDLLESKSDDSKDPGATPAAALAIGGVNLSAATISWQDALTENQASIDGLSLATGPVSLGDPIQLNLEFNVQASEPALSGHVRLAGEFGFDPATQVAKADGLSLEASINGALVPGGAASITASGNAVFDQANQILSLAGFSLSVPELKLDSGNQANVTITGDIEGNLGNGRYQSQNLVVEGGISGENIPGLNMPFKLTSNFDANLNDETLVVHEYRITSAIASATGTAAVTKLLTEPQFKGELKLDPFNPRELLAKLGASAPETSDAKALSSLELETSFEGTATGITLKPLSAKLDDTLMTGNIAIADFGSQALRVELVMDTLDADRYLPPGTAAATPGAAAPAATGLPLETIRGLDVDAKLALGKLHVSGLDLDNIRVSLLAKDGLVKMSPLRAGLYGGTYEGNLALDARGDQARIALDEKLTGVQVGKLLAALAIDTGDMDLSDAAGDLSIKAKVSGDPEKQRFTLKGTSVKANVSGSGLPGGKLIAAADADLDLDLSKQLVSGRAVNLTVRNLILPNGLRTTGTVAADAITARLAANSYSASGVDVDLKALQLSPDTNSTPLKLLVSQLETDLGKQTLTADNFNVSALGLKASGKVAIANMIDNPQLAGVLDMPALNPKQLMKVFGLPPVPTADPKALTSLAIKTTFKASPNSLSLRPLSLKLDDTKIDGAIDIADIQAFKGINFDLSAGSLNADRYLPPQAQGQAATPGAAATALPLDVLRNLDINGRLKMSQLVFSNMQITEINLTITGKDGVVRMNPVGALLYGGSYQGDINVDARGKAAQLTLNESLERVHIGPLLRDYTLKEEKLTGRGGVRIQATATGVNTDEMIKTLNGQTAVLLQDGSIKGIDIVNTICNLVSGGSGGDTRFAELTASGTIQNGVLDSRDLNVKSPLIRVGGAGTVDLVSRFVDYLATVRLVGTCQGQGGLAFGDLSGIDVPVRFKGPIDSVKPNPDLGAVTTQLIQKGVVDDLGKKLGIEELEGLGGILGGSTQQPQSGSTLPTETQQQPQQQEKKDPLEELGRDLLKGLFQ